MYHALETRYQGMQYNRVGHSGLKLPAISLGLCITLVKPIRWRLKRKRFLARSIWASLISIWRIIRGHQRAAPRKTLGGFYMIICVAIVMK